MIPARLPHCHPHTGPSERFQKLGTSVKAMYDAKTVKRCPWLQWFLILTMLIQDQDHCGEMAQQQFSSLSS